MGPAVQAPNSHQSPSTPRFPGRVDGGSDTRPPRPIKLMVNVLRWVQETTRSWAGVVLISPKGTKLKYVLQINFSHVSNNEAEYEALLHGMRMAKTCGATRLVIYGDSNLVVQ